MSPLLVIFIDPGFNGTPKLCKMDVILDNDVEPTAQKYHTPGTINKSSSGQLSIVTSEVKRRPPYAKT